MILDYKDDYAEFDAPTAHFLYNKNYRYATLSCNIKSRLCRRTIMLIDDVINAPRFRFLISTRCLARVIE